MLALSVMDRVSLSMGEEAVQSMRVWRESMATEATGPWAAGGATSVGGSGVGGCTICVTGRIVGLCAVVASLTEGLKESSKDLRPESGLGTGDGEGHISGLGGLEGLEGLLLAKGGLESDLGVMGESVTRGKGRCLGGGLGMEGSKLDSVGGQELTFKDSADVSSTGTGGGVNGGGRLSCIDGASGSTKLA